VLRLQSPGQFAELAEVHAVVIAVPLVHLARSRILDRGQIGHHVGYRRLSYRRLGHLSLPSIISDVQATTRFRPPVALAVREALLPP
jgi:hypothetical protein